MAEFQSVARLERIMAAQSEDRFAAYVEALSAALGHADRRGPFEDYCLGLLIPVEHKSVEPLTVVTAPGRTTAQHQSLLHFVGQGSWSDERVMSAIRDQVLPSIERQYLLRLPRIGFLLTLRGWRPIDSGR